MLLDLMDKSLVYRKTGRGTTELAAWSRLILGISSSIFTKEDRSGVNRRW